MTGLPQAADSIITSPKGSGQQRGRKEGFCLAEELVFLAVADLADELHMTTCANERTHARLVIAPVLHIDFGGYFERNPRALGDLDGILNSFFRANPP